MVKTIDQREDRIMPNYEFRCIKCNEKFSLQISISDYENRKTFTCPKCKSNETKRVFSGFTAMTSKKS